MKLLRWLFDYRVVPMSDMRVKWWQAQARAAKADQRWPMLRRVA
jgi:hypothetical protein